MSNINQSLIKIFKNSEDNVVLAYGSAHGLRYSKYRVGINSY